MKNKQIYSLLDKQDDLDIIYVNYKSTSLLMRSIDELKFLVSEININLNIIVINNSYSEENKKESQRINDFCQKRSGKKVKIIYYPSEINHGFGKACNIASRLSNSKKILFLNCDTSFKRTNPLNFIKFLNSLSNKIAIVGPRIVSESDQIINSFFSFHPKFIIFKPINHIRIIGNISKKLFSIKFFSNLNNNLKYKNINIKKSISVDWISGCCMLINREFFEKNNGFDERYFLYFEDVDICRKAKLVNLKVIYDPRIKIIHEGKHESMLYRGILRSLLINKTSRYHIHSWLKYIYKWRNDFIQYFIKIIF